MNLKWISANWNAANNINALTTTRIKGVSSPPFDSFNLGMHVDDNLADVKKNRTKLEGELSLPASPLWLKQTHGNTVIEAKDYTPQIEADAIFTTEENTILVIQTADCLPILLCSDDGNWIAGIHAGWQGFTHDLIEKTVKAYPGNPQSLMAWLGPSISMTYFEIGLDVLERIIRGSKEKKFARINSKIGKAYLSLPDLAKHRLTLLGLDKIFFSNCCTYENKKHFYSYRRDKITGRMASLIYKKTFIGSL